MTAYAVASWRQFRLERRMFWRNPTAAFFGVLLPLGLLAIFGAVFAGQHKEVRAVEALMFGDMHGDHRVQPAGALRSVIWGGVTTGAPPLGRAMSTLRHTVGVDGVG